MVVYNSAQAPESLCFLEESGKVVTGDLLSNNFYSSYLSLGEVQTVYYYANRTGQVLSFSAQNTSSLGVISDPENPNYIWAVYSSFPPSAAVGCGINRLDAMTGALIATYDLSSLAPTGQCVLNDLTAFYDSSLGKTTKIYATNYWTYQIHVLDVTTNTISVLSNDTSILCDGPVCTGDSYNGPNGIDMWLDTRTNTYWLLITVTPTRLVKMSVADGSANIVRPGINTPTNALQGLDGFVLMNTQGDGYDDSRWKTSVIYAAGWLAPGGTIQVLSSTDGWTTYDMRVVYNTACRDSDGYASTTTVRKAGVGVLALCANGFNPGYFSVNTINDVVWMNNPIARTTQIIVQPNMQPDNLAYDPNRNMIVLTSLLNGTIRGFPYNVQGKYGRDVLTYSIEDSHEYVKEGTSGMVGTTGIQVNPDNFFKSQCYALVCMSSHDAETVYTDVVKNGLYLIDLCTDTIVSYVYLPTEEGESLANDVAVITSSKTAYVTDLLGHQVWSVYLGKTAGVYTLESPMAVLNSASCAWNDPIFCVTLPNGIVSKTSTDGATQYLVISMYETGLMKYTPSTGELLRIGDVTGVLFAFDGMTFNTDQSVIYGARNDAVTIASGGPNYQSVMAFTSCNNWLNATLLYTFQTNCNGSNTPATEIIANSDGTEDLLILCNDAFGTGPYSIQIVQDVGSVVANQPLTPGSCVYAYDGDDDGLSQGAAVGISITLVFLVTLCAVFVMTSTYVKTLMGYTSASAHDTHADDGSLASKEVHAGDGSDTSEVGDV